MNGCGVEGRGQNAFLVKPPRVGYPFRSGQPAALWGGQYPPVPAFNHSKLESPHGLIVGKGCPTGLGSAGVRLTSTSAWVSHLIGSKGVSSGAGGVSSVVGTSCPGRVCQPEGRLVHRRGGRDGGPDRSRRGCQGTQV